jgi:hypothetical protein
MTTIAQLLATTALIMGGTQHPLTAPTDQPPFVNTYMGNAVNGYIVPAGTNEPINRVAVYTPEEFFPTFGSRTFDQSVEAGRGNLNKCVHASSGCVYNTAVGSNAPAAGDTFVIFGYSQSAVVATQVKRDLIAGYDPTNPGATPQTSFVLVANPNRPNGGILERFYPYSIPILGVTFNGATPTNSPTDSKGNYIFPTTDVVRQYDGWGDFPAYPLNLLATANAIAGIYYLHGDYSSVGLGDAVYQGTTGDTRYYIIPTQRLPILRPLAQLGVPDPILAVLDAPLRVLIEAGYARTTNPGVPTLAGLVPLVNPITLLGNVAGSIPVGIDNGLQGIGVGRALGTTPAGPFGVGGPTLPAPPPAAPMMAAATAGGLGPAVTTESTATTDPPASSRSTILAAATAGGAARPATAMQAPTTTQAKPLEPAATGASSPTVEPTPAVGAPAQAAADPPPTQQPATTAAASSTPPVTRAEPDRPKVRGPIEFDAPKPPALPPAGDKPSKGVSNALTGQGSKPAADAGAPAAASAAGGQSSNAA